MAHFGYRRSTALRLDLDCRYAVNLPEEYYVSVIQKPFLEDRIAGTKKIGPAFAAVSSRPRQASTGIACLQFIDHRPAR